MHKSGRFRYDEEVWGPTPAQQRDEDRSDLGHRPKVPGEAFAFRGRAGIQLTGRHNYRGFRDWCQEKIDPAAPDFKDDPDAVTTDPWEGLAPIWYWDAGNPTGRSLNAFADDNNAEAVTREIKSGLKGSGSAEPLHSCGARLARSSAARCSSTSATRASPVGASTTFRVRARAPPCTAI